MNNSKEKKLFLIVKNILENHGDEIDNISIHEDGSDYLPNESFRIYSKVKKEGYAWDISKYYCCDPEDSNFMDGVESDGFSYSFTEIWDGFDQSGIDKAMEILSVYGQPLEIENDFT